MPPRTRTLKKTNNLKENAGVTVKNKQKADGKSDKPVRKALADKTNSASDDNASLEAPKKVARKPPAVSKAVVEINRPRRDRRLPGRFANNEVLKNLSSSKENALVTPTKQGLKHSEPSPFKSPVIIDSSLLASRPKRIHRLPSKLEDHFISPSKYIPVQPCHASTPIVQKKLPDAKTKNNKSVDITPSKPVQDPSSKKSDNRTSNVTNDAQNSSKVNGCRPLRARRAAQKDTKPKTTTAVVAKKTVVKKVRSPSKSPAVVIKKTAVSKVKSPSKSPAFVAKKTSARKIPSPNKSPAFLVKRTAVRKVQSSSKSPAVVAKKTAVRKIVESPTKKIQNSNQNTIAPIDFLACPSSNRTPIKNVPSPRKVRPRIAKKSPINNSFRMLDSKKLNQQNKSSEDVYEFTYDPNEEPPPQKKKKRVVTKKKPAKPRSVTVKNNYDQNLSKSLAALKNVVSRKPTQITEAQTSAAVMTQQSNVEPTQKQNKPVIQQKITPSSQKAPIQQQIIPKPCSETVSEPQKLVTFTNNPETSAQSAPYNFSIPIEDIAADLDATPHHDINYSPSHTPHPNTIVPSNSQMGGNRSARSVGPLNIREELSFFDDEPVASSSMNVSTRRPHASPWRAEFDRLPMKWHVNSYVKPNMTPAVECSFVNFNEEKKKYVYTNIVPERDDKLPEIAQNEQPSMVQTSIISFFKEVVENSAKKKNRERSKTPATSAVFDDISSTTNKPDRILSTPRKSVERQVVTPNRISEITPNSSDEKENSRNRQKRKNESDEHVVPAKTARKEKDSSEENTFFGFDESEDQENIHNGKDNEKVHKLRSRSRAVLKEINEQTGPTRAMIPRGVKTTANLDMVNKLYDEFKSAEEAPDIADKNIGNPEVTTVSEGMENDASDEDSQSVHLFEDIEFCHHFNKPQRKSYGRAKKVTFRQPSYDSDSQLEVQKKDGSSSEEDDALDLTFEVPAEERKTKKKAGKKKMTKKQKLNKKEAAEAEAWAAGFNSMCEDVEEFPLVVE